ncbi:MAG: hypothetical protein PHI63_00855 [Patescibacteria group bacterium]|nr:hypothetical protein [Patescibacteria group bacterium]
MFDNPLWFIERLMGFAVVALCVICVVCALIPPVTFLLVWLLIGFKSAAIAGALAAITVIVAFKRFIRS